MRPNILGWLLVTGFLIGGIVFAVASPDTRLLGLIWIASALLVMLAFVGMLYRARKAEELRRTGIPGVAIIRSVTQGGTYVNNQPLVTLDLEVHPESLPVYSVRKRMIVPVIGLGQLGIGNELPVYVDRKDQERVVVDWGAV
jgi:hypothetical protein